MPIDRSILQCIETARGKRAVACTFRQIFRRGEAITLVSHRRLCMKNQPVTYVGDTEVAGVQLEPIDPIAVGELKLPCELGVRWQLVCWRR